MDDKQHFHHNKKELLVDNFVLHIDNHPHTGEEHIDKTTNRSEYIRQCTAPVYDPGMHDT
jgi:hypothetical protein